MYCQRLSVGLKFSNTFVYVNLLPVLKGYNKALRELIEYLLTHTVYNIIVVAGTVCVLIVTAFLKILAAFKALENLVAGFKMV